MKKLTLLTLILCLCQSIQSYATSSITSSIEKNSKREIKKEILAANTAFKKRENSLGIKYIKKAADNGDSDIQLFYALILHDGRYEVEPDIKQAEKYYKLAADQNNKEAQYIYSSLLRGGEGVKENLKESLKYLKKAAYNGHTKAQSLLDTFIDNLIDAVAVN